MTASPLVPGGTDGTDRAPRAAAALAADAAAAAASAIANPAAAVPAADAGHAVARLTAQLEAARMVEDLLKDQVHQLKEQLRKQEALYERQIAVLKSQLSPASAVTVAADAAPAAAAFPQASFTDTWLRESRYKDTMSKFGSMLFSCNHPDAQVQATLVRFWDNMGGAKQWFQLYSPETLSLVLSRDERSCYDLNINYERAQGHKFVEHVLSRLPRLGTVRLNSMAYALDEAELAAVGAGAFPAMRSLDVSNSELTDEQLATWVRALPGLEHLNISGCGRLTWDGVRRAVEGRPRAVAVTPTTAEAFVAGQGEGLVGKYFTEYIASDTEFLLVRLWNELGGKAGWRDKITPHQLTALLARSDLRCVRVRAVKDTYMMGCELIDAAEAVEFVTQILSRLPKMEFAKFLRFPRWPFDWDAVAAAGVEKPFPMLKGVDVRDTAWTTDVLQLAVARLPTLRAANGPASPGSQPVPDGLMVHLNDGPAGVDVMDMRRACQQKLYVWVN